MTEIAAAAGAGDARRSCGSRLSSATRLRRSSGSTTAPPTPSTTTAAATRSTCWSSRGSRGARRCGGRERHDGRRRARGDRLRDRPRARNLSSEGRSLINSAAVVGDPFSLDIRCGPPGWTPPRASTRWTSWSSPDLVHPTDVPRRFQFRHPLVRAAIYDAVPHGTRLAIHSACADLLRGRQRRPGRARTSRRAGGAAGRHGGGGGASRRRARVGATCAGERRALAARGAAPAPRRCRSGPPPGAPAAAAGPADLAQRLPRRLRGDAGRRSTPSARTRTTCAWA